MSDFVLFFFAERHEEQQIFQNFEIIFGEKER